jgi:hypothetical protein
MASLETQVIAAIGENLADGYVSMTAEVNEAASTSTVLFGAKATKGVTAQAALLIKASVDGMGGTIAQGGFMGSFYIYPDANAPGIPVFSATSAGVTMQDVYFRRLRSVKKNPDGSRVIDINGDTGAFSITVA